MSAPSCRSFLLSRCLLVLATLGQAVGCSHKKSAGVPDAMGARAMLRCTVGAALKDPVGTPRIGSVVLRDRLRTLVLGDASVIRPAGSGAKALAAGTGAGGEAFEALLDREKLPPRTSGSLEFFIDGREFFPVYLKELQAARKSIDVETFIFDTDDVAAQVADVLRAKSAQMPVRVRFDGLGSDQAAKVQAKSMPASFKPLKDARAYLTAGSGVACRRTGNACFVADHSKLHLIDGDRAFVGGMNVGREYRYEWHDMMARVEGPVVQELARLYDKRWRCDAWWHQLQQGKRVAASTATTTQPPPAAEAKDQREARRQVPLRVLHTDASHGRQQILKATLLGIRCASRRVWIETPYFSCDEIIQELQAALKRGVDVRIVIPQKADADIMQANNGADMRKLIEHGAKVWAYPGMTHLKATVCDDWAMFGSANYDTLSQRINVELNLATSDPHTVRTLATRVFEHDFRTGTRLTAEMAKAKGGPLAELIGDQL
ncbi:MAG: phosphatidylserine/phosphatidylglycerophosphate/cardiolipin synthase family protein [Verrucomicrobia bacterium]|nr:phosphatidylserine/phosphatidylglycerophosphate/cardiolipin synthase family protein [Verrucomicrobiota bacterium]